MKKFIFIILSLFIIFFTSIILFESLIKTTLFVYKNIPKSEKYSYIYVLGESSAAGFPYIKFSYSTIIKEIVNNRIDNKKIVVINLSTPGCRLIHQYVSYFLYRLSHPQQKGILVLYTGTNDMNVNMKNNKIISKTLLFLDLHKPVDNYFYFLLEFINRKISNSFCHKILNIIDSFEYEYEKIINLSKKIGDEIYVSTLAKNYVNFHPNISIYHNKYEKEMNEIDSQIFSNNLDKAEILCKKYLSNNNYKIKNPFYYRLGKIYELKGLISEANKAYIKADTNIFFNKNITIEKNKIIKFLAKKYKIEYIDLFSILYNSNKTIGLNYFTDNIHPTMDTNIILSYEFVKKISKRHKVKITPVNIFDINHFLNKYKYNNNDRLRIKMNIVTELEYNEYTYKYNTGNINNLIKEINNLKIDENKRPDSKDRNEFLQLQKDYFYYYTNKKWKSLNETKQKLADQNELCGYKFTVL